MDLVDFQRHFSNLIFDAPEMSAKDLQEFAAGLVYPDRMCAYIDGYPARVSDALSECYVQLAALLEEDFDQLVEDFALQRRPTHYDLADLCRKVPEFMAGHEVLKDYPALTALARFELALHDSFHAGERPKMSLDALCTSLSAEGEDFSALLQPHANLLQVDWRAAQLLEQVKAGQFVYEDQDSFAPFQEPVCYLIYRDGYAPSYLEFADLPQVRCLEGLCRGEQLGPLCDHLESLGAPVDVGSMLVQLARLGLLVAA